MLLLQGMNNAGQLGDGSTSQRNEPTAVAGAGKWLMVATGQAHTCSLRDDYRLLCWVRSAPSHSFAGLKAMPGWSCAFDVHYHGRWLSNRLCAQGYNVDGQVGDGTKSNRLTPTQVHFDGWWEAVSTGDHHTCGIRTGGQLWCWVSARGCGTVRMGDAVGYAFC
jgi:hypothetical protein